MLQRTRQFYERMSIYTDIHLLREKEHRSIQWIANYLGLNFRTVRKYLKMSLEEYEKYADQFGQKPRLLEDYKDFIAEKLRQYPDTGAAQMHDWLKEAYPFFPEVCPRTIYNTVMEVRQEANIPRVSVTERDYHVLPESPSGQYAQVDFGQKKLRKGDGKTQKVYFMAMLLCRSRYKYIWFQNKPFTSETAVIAHEKAFEYFRGIPKEIIYDQDAVFLWDENIGDYIMTKVFDAYVKSRPFKPVFCRPGDPESKGKVENCVKYVKQNFLTNRPYSDLETLQEQAEAWLKRTGNAMVHATTCKIPFEEWSSECKDLYPYVAVLLPKEDAGHAVLKTNCVRYKGNIYSVPVGTYKGNDTRVRLEENGATLIISSMSGGEIARHIMPAGRGNIVTSDSHKHDSTIKLAALTETVTSLFSDKEEMTMYLSRVHDRYGRYMRDQLMTVSDACTGRNQEEIDKALDTCMKRGLFSANDFKAAINGNVISSTKEKTEVAYKSVGDERTTAIAHFQPGKSDLSVYDNIVSCR